MMLNCKMKKTFVALIVLLCMMAMSSMALSENYCGDNIIWNIDDEGTLLLSGSGRTYDFETQKAPWYAQRDSISHIVIGDGIEYIGSHAFEDCNNLQSIIFGKNVYGLGTNFLFNCPQITELSLPFCSIRGIPVISQCDNLTVYCKRDPINMFNSLRAGNVNFVVVDSKSNFIIEKDTLFGFAGDTKKVVVPAGVKVLYPSTLAYLQDTEIIVLPDSVEKIYDRVFENCPKLKCVVMSKNLAEIGTLAFAGCQSLSAIVIPEGIHNITNDLFSGCSSLEAIYLHADIVSIQNGAFSGCDSLKTVYYAGDKEMRKKIDFGNNTNVQNAKWVYASDGLPDDDYDVPIREMDVCILKGKKYDTKDTIIRDYTTNKNDIWESSDDNIATVSKGVITAKANGKCEITCKASENNLIAKYHVEVRTPVQSVMINEKNVTVLVGADESFAQAQLTYTVKPEDAFYQSGIWTSSNEEIVTVDANGNIKGIQAGKAIITFISDEPTANIKAQINIKVSQAVTGITLEETVYDIPVGKTHQVKVNVEPTNAENKQINWSSSNETIVKVSNGQIKAISPGTAEIKAEANDGSGVSATCKVTVYSPLANRQEGDYVFFVDQKQNVTIVKYTGTAKNTLTVPDMIAGKPVTCIAEKAFERCQANTVVLPDTVVEIGTQAFYYAETTSIQLPDTKLTIGYEAFMCSKIREIYIPANATIKGGNPFRGCKQLTLIKVDPENKLYEIYEGAFVIKKTMELIVIPYANIGKTLAIPDGIKIIGSTAFGYEGPTITELIIPDSVQTINSSAFAFSSVQHIIIGSGIRKMDYGPFTYCKSLRSVEIKNGATIIGSGAFSYSENLREIIIPNSVKNIAKDAFSGVPLVKFITSPNSTAAAYANKNGFNWEAPSD